jgi:hypothetical protein
MVFVCCVSPGLIITKNISMWFRGGSRTPACCRQHQEFRVLALLRHRIQYHASCLCRAGNNIDELPAYCLFERYGFAQSPNAHHGIVSNEGGNGKSQVWRQGIFRLL